jgi:hypothetical protein
VTSCAIRDTSPPEKIAAALDWAERASLPVAELEDTATVRLALAACAKTLTGKAATRSTQRRKRSVFCNALGYAVEQGHLAANPVERIQWTTPAVAQSVDRRVVVSPAQARPRLGGAGCETVDSAYVGSNPTPATRCGNGPLAADLRLRGPFAFIPSCVTLSRCRPRVAGSTDA